MFLIFVTTFRMQPSATSLFTLASPPPWRCPRSTPISIDDPVGPDLVELHLNWKTNRAADDLAVGEAVIMIDIPQQISKYKIMNYSVQY